MLMHDTPEDEQDHQEKLEQVLADHMKLHPEHQEMPGRAPVAEFQARDEAFHEIADRLPPAGIDVHSDLVREEVRDVGHAIGKHVGRTLDELHTFPSYASESGASSFETPGHAAEAINDALREATPDVMDWLTGADTRNHVVDFDLGRPTGRWARESDHPEGTEVTGVRVVLAKDADDSRGFVFRTAFPIPGDQVEARDHRRR